MVEKGGVIGIALPVRLMTQSRTSTKLRQQAVLTQEDFSSTNERKSIKPQNIK